MIIINNESFRTQQFIKQKGGAIFAAGKRLLIIIKVKSYH
jgi:hypothetical protein